MGWMWLFGPLLLIGIVLLTIVAVRALGGGISRGAGDDHSKDGRSSGRSRAREVLDERYARGDLSSEEYRERLRVLGEDT